MPATPVEAAPPATLCSYAGTWHQSNVFGQEFIWTVTPLDPTAQRFALVGDLASGGLGGSGFFPEVAFTTATRGTAVRTSTDSFQFTLYSTGRDIHHQKVYDVVISGVTVLTGCDTAEEVWTFEFFTPEGISVFCGQAASTSERLGIVPPCRDLPSPSE